MIPTPQELGFPEHYQDWRDEQTAAIEEGLAAKSRFVGQNLPTGSGKSASAMAQAVIQGGRTIYLTSTKGLQDQILREFSKCGMVDIRGKSAYQCNCDPELTCEEGNQGKCHYKGTSMCNWARASFKAKSAPLVTTNYACWIAANKYGTGFGNFDFMILDECFPAGTKVGSRNIEDLTVGDLVPSFDTNSGRIVERRVVETMRRTPSTLVRIHLADKSSLVCTPSHPFWTPDGWKIAIELIGSLVLRSSHATKDVPPSGNQVRQMWQATNPDHPQSEVRVSEAWQGSLQPILCSPASEFLQPISGGAGREGKPDAEAQPHERSQGQGEDENYLTGNGMEAPSSWRERNRSDIPAAIIGVHPGMGYGSGSIDRSTGDGDSRTLQTGHSQSSSEDRNRGGWNVPPNSSDQDAGLQERQVLSWVRVDRVEVYEPTSPDELRELCPDGFVYNIEVEETHTYLANGIVVHNCHNAPDELARAMQIQISCHEVEEMICRKWPEAGRDSMETWKKWAHVAKLTGELKRDELAASIARDKRPRASHLKQLAHYKNLVHKLADIATCVPQHWVVDEWEKGYQFDPINPAQYGERVLFRGIGRVLLTSATIRPRTLEMIGIQPESFEFYDYPSNFLPTRSPIYHIPTVKLSHKATEEDIRIWINTVDEICSGRFDRKGIIHVPSFRLRDEILARSLMAPYMMSNFREAKDITSAVVEAFKVAATPSILVSPSVSTGYDFPGDACRYQIIGKVPFPDERGKVAKARKELDKDLGIYQAIQQLVQAAGRGMRSRKDWQEVFILDDNIAWLFWKYREYFPRWFPSFFKTYRGVPNAMKPPVDRRAA